MNIKTLALAMALAGLAGGAAQASAVTYELTGVGTYDLDGLQHTGAFDIIGTGDTGNVMEMPSPPFYAGTFANGASPFGSPPFSVEFKLDGVGTFDMTVPSYVFYVQSTGVGGFGSEGHGDLIYFAGGPGSYDLTSSIGPISVASALPPGQFAPTTGGSLQFIDTSNEVFSSSVAGVPEPTTWAMLILGLGMIGFAVRRQREAMAVAT